MKIDLTKDELRTLTYSLVGSIKDLKAYKSRAKQRFGEDLDEMYDTLIQKCMALQKKLYGALTTLEDQER